MGEAAAKKRAFALVSPLGDPVSAGPQRSHPVTRDGIPLPFFPVGTRLCVERLPPDTMVAGLHIPDSAQEKLQYGTLIAAGPAAQGMLDDMGIDIGDTICFGKHAGLEWTWLKHEPEDTPIDKREPTVKRRRSVEIIRAEDILGGKELAEKMIDGTKAIALYCPDCGGMKDDAKHENHTGTVEYRFFEQTGMK